MAKKILVVDDDKRIVDVIAFNLHREGYEVICAGDGARGLELALSEQPDLIVLDIMMPKMDGFEVTRRVRERSQVPIILLSARAEESDKVFGLEHGADDYVTKPYSMKELMARINANTRRVPDKSSGGEVIRSGELEIFIDRFDVRKGGVSIPLTNKEFELLKYLASHSEKVFSRTDLLEHVWNYEYLGGDARNVDVTIKRLRSKIEDDPANPEYILTKRGVGYYFAAD